MTTKRRQRRSDSVMVKIPKLKVNVSERQNWDLNPEFLTEQDFQSCAIPGYAILAIYSPKLKNLMCFIYLSPPSKIYKEFLYYYNYIIIKY